MKYSGILGIFVALVIFSANATAVEPHANEGLDGVTVGKVVWDVSLADPQKLLPNFRVLRQTYDDLVARKIKPEMVITFRGPVVKLLTTNIDQLPTAEKQAAGGVQQIIQDLATRDGIQLLACGISTRAFGVDNVLMSEVKSVSNSFLPLLGYQSKGYALIAIP